jgi:nucleotide-binding universal stress UspA family protein
MQQSQRRRILLATDLSARCDRAFERAILLADAWGADLTIVHALDGPESGRASSPRWRRIDRETLSAESQILADLYRAGIAAEIVVRRGPPAELIAEIAGKTSCDLIVTGIARELGLARAVLGATLEALAHKSTAPILIASRPVRGAYENAVVGTSFSPGARAALQATLRLFQKAKVVALHAYRAPVERFGSVPVNDETAYLHHRDECARFVVDAVPDAWEKVRCLAEAGAPETLLKEYALDRKADLIAVGSETRSPVATVLLGSTSTSLILSSPCDLLLVPARWTSPGDGVAAVPHGSQDQLMHEPTPEEPRAR